MTNRIAMDRFNDLNRQGFMKQRSPRKARITASEVKADAVRLAQADAARDAMYARWAAEDAS